jgi:hypothetical protein
MRVTYEWVVKDVDVATGEIIDVDGSSIESIKRLIATPPFDGVKYRIYLYRWEADGSDHDDIEVENGELTGWAPKHIKAQFDRIKADLVKCGHFL